MTRSAARKPVADGGPPTAEAHLAVIATAVRGRVGDRVYKTYGRRIFVTRVPNCAGYVPRDAQRARAMGPPTRCDARRRAASR